MKKNPNQPTTFSVLKSVDSIVFHITVEEGKPPCLGQGEGHTSSMLVMTNMDHCVQVLETHVGCVWFARAGVDYLSRYSGFSSDYINCMILCFSTGQSTTMGRSYMFPSEDFFHQEVREAKSLALKGIRAHPRQSQQIGHVKYPYSLTAPIIYNQTENCILALIIGWFHANLSAPGVSL